MTRSGRGYILGLAALLAMLACGLFVLSSHGNARPAYASAGTFPLVSPTATATPTVACALGWNVVPSANVGTGSSDLFGVAALSATDAWAVGYYTLTDNSEMPMIERWDGTRWSIHRRGAETRRIQM